MPKPRPGESETDFIERCVPIVLEDGAAGDEKQAVAICHSLYKKGKSMPTTHEKLLNAIRSRQEKRAEFNTGILTADCYVKTLQECVGSDLCYRYAAKGNVSFQDVLKAASSKLTYNNEDMVVEDIYLDYKSRFSGDGTEIELPKNTLMVFRHVLTTPKKDRDGDILRTKGASVDPKMLLLWQHVHTLPIGKMLGVVEHTSKKLSLITAIVDLNELSHDAAVMVDNDMLRFSHGFKAIEFESMKGKEEDGRTTSPGGFDVKEFEILEESGVSVPSNTDSEVEDVYLNLIEGGKMTSSIMKTYGKRLREQRPTQIPGSGPLDINVNVTVKDKTNGNNGKPAKTAGCGCGQDPCECGGINTSEKANGGDSKEDQAKTEEMTCPKCDSKIVDGVCEKCGYKMPPEKSKKEDDEDDKEDKKVLCPECAEEMGDATKCPNCGHVVKGNDDKDKDKDDKKEFDGEKVGRVLSKRNYEKLVDAADDLKEIHDKHTSTRSGRALCDKCYKTIVSVVKSAGQDTSSDEAGFEDGAALVILKASPDERKQLMAVLQVLESLDQQKTTTRHIRKLVLSGK